MKLKLKIPCFVFMIFTLFFAGTFAAKSRVLDIKQEVKPYKTVSLSEQAEAASSYIIDKIGEEYVADTGAEYVKSTSLAVLLEQIDYSGRELYFSSVTTDENINITSNSVITGALSLDNSNLNIDAASVSFKELNLTLSGGSVRVKGGELYLNGGFVKSKGASAFLLDYSSSAKLHILQGSVSAEAKDAAVLCDKGSVFLTGGTVSSAYSAAVENHGSLWLGGKIKISGEVFDIVTDNPVRLSFGDSYEDFDVRVKYQREFRRGSLTEVFYGASQEALFGIKLYDIKGAKVDVSYHESSAYSEEKKFIAVYLPFYARFYVGDALVSTKEFLDGEITPREEDPKKEGYDFSGWYTDASLKVPYAFGNCENGDINLYAGFSLMKPQFSLNSMKFTYDMKEHALSFESLYHPLMNEGSFSYVWYKDNEPVLYGESGVKIRGVSQSGDYFCKLTFAYDGDFVTIVTPKVRVEVDKMTLIPPVLEDAFYTGSYVYPSPNSSELYTLMSNGGINVGTYSATLTLTDPANCKWNASDEPVLNITFNIIKASNKFLSELSVGDVYEGVSASPFAESLFGTVSYLYSADMETWSSSAPTAAGEYFIKAVVEESENYGGITSSFVKFNVLPEVCIGIRIDKNPDKTEYLAFEKVSLAGAKFTLFYNSGRQASADIESLSVEYRSEGVLHVGDRSVTLRADDASVPLEVTVRAASYDLSGLVFEDKTVVYDGKHHTVDIDFSLTGLDGIPLCAYVSGGGIEAGKHTLTLRFESESVNYIIPSQMSATLTISPLSVTVLYENLRFIYDGTTKLPTARIVTAEGLLLPLSVRGGAADAGEYTVEAIAPSGNYTLKNPTAEFIIEKAELDFSSVYWSSTSYPFNGEFQSVSILGLPDNVTLIGYTDAKFKDAGEYIASAILSYDEKNFNPPPSTEHKWRITPIEYDMSASSFVGGIIVYDKTVHYPTLVGKLPIGLDGSSPEYRFSGGLSDVTGKEEQITVTFVSGSKNYKAPKSIIVSMQIIPMDIEVFWRSEEFVYNGAHLLPAASSDKCTITVTGGGIDAGKYTARATADDKNYNVTNNTFEYEIKKANNFWEKEPTAADIFEGTYPTVTANAHHGEVCVEFFTEGGECAENFSAGFYYALVYVPEGKNYLALEAVKIGFRAMEILPTELVVLFIGDGIYAMREISGDDIEAYFINNDGSRSAIDFSDIKIEYQGGGLPTALDTEIKFTAGAFSVKSSVNIKKSFYDMNDVCWLPLSSTYNGEYITPTLSGLPGGVEVVKYEFSPMKDAGVYILSAILSYDEVNYNEPVCPNMSFTVLPREITVQVNADKSFFVKEGSIIAGDSLQESFYTEDGYIYMSCENPNYYVTVIPAKESVISVWLIILFACLFVLLLAAGFVIYRNRDRLILLTVKSNAKAVKPERTQTVSEGGVSPAPENEAPAMTTLLAVDEAHADTLIPDFLAKNLLSDSKITVKTSGKRRAIINIDTISESFNAGDVVDINAMKEKGLISPDARYVKVLARGVIDKPINVIANAYSLTAVKMIALTGGSAKRAHTSKR